MYIRGGYMKTPQYQVLQFFFVEKIEKISTLRPINKNFVNQGLR